MREARVIRVDQTILAEVEGQVVHVRHAKGYLRHPRHARQNRRAHLVAGVLDRGTRDACISWPRELLDKDLHDAAAILHERSGSR